MQPIEKVPRMRKPAPAVNAARERARRERREEIKHAASSRAGQLAQAGARS